MNSNKKLRVHLIGIGGVGISALAQFYFHKGYEVTGTNDNPSPETLNRIRALGVKIYIGADIENIDPKTDLIVYSDAWLTMEPIFMEELRKLDIPMLSYFEALGRASDEWRTVAVAGTHGKTTTTGMLAKILKDERLSPTAIVGSIVIDFQSNYLPGDSDIFVVEACEYQRHFLNLSPEVLVVTNLEYDHTDYFKDLEDVQNAFRTLMEKVPSNGAIVTDVEHPNIQPLLERLATDADIEGRTLPQIIDYRTEPAYELRLPGEFNQQNARAAAAAARVLVPDSTDTQIRRSLAEFHGTWRRFEYKGKTASGAELYDDYAHHPTAIQETLRALRARVGKGRIIVAFHPHLYSRTRDLLDGFARSFSDADEVIVAPIYAAREIDDGTISSQILAERITENGTSAHAAKSLGEVQAFLEKAGPDDTIMTMGAGDIYRVADALIGK